MVTFSLLKILFLVPSFTNQKKVVEFNFEFHLKDFVPMNTYSKALGYSWVGTY